MPARRTRRSRAPGTGGRPVHSLKRMSKATPTPARRRRGGAEEAGGGVRAVRGDVGPARRTARIAEDLDDDGAGSGGPSRTARASWEERIPARVQEGARGRDFARR